jgi:hypothetical protein
MQPPFVHPSFILRYKEQDKPAFKAGLAIDNGSKYYR